jgi:very-short-patch-repair endonuclease
MSLPEGLLWRELRKRPGGFKFRRQHPLRPYIADFYCPAVRLVVEVDGLSHAMGDRPQRDEARDRFMQEQGFRVLRIAATDVMNDLEAVLTMIVRACACPLPLHHAAHGPPPHGCAAGRN